MLTLFVELAYVETRALLRYIVHILYSLIIITRIIIYARVNTTEVWIQNMRFVLGTGTQRHGLYLLCNDTDTIYVPVNDTIVFKNDILKDTRASNKHFTYTRTNELLDYTF